MYVSVREFECFLVYGFIFYLSHLNDVQEQYYFWEGQKCLGTELLIFVLKHLYFSDESAQIAFCEDVQKYKFIHLVVYVQENNILLEVFAMYRVLD